MKIKCLFCEQQLEVADELLGKSITCPACKEFFEIQEGDLTEAPKEKKCPFCGEMIKVEAVKCKHCGEFLFKQSEKKVSATQSEIDHIKQLENHSKLLWWLVALSLFLLWLILW